jgi:DNA modification methylase
MVQLRLFEELPHQHKLPTNLTTNYYPIHRWFNFIAGFSPEFVSSCIKELGSETDGILIDPFAGLSTALVQANFIGMPSVGFEPHPFFYDISLAKIIPPVFEHEIDAIQTIAQSQIEPYTGEFSEIWTQDAITFLTKLIPQPNLRLLAQALLLESQIEITHRPLYRLIVSKVLEYTTSSQTDGIYKAPTTAKNSLPYDAAIRKVCTEIRMDIRTIGGKLNPQATLYPTSSEHMTSVADESCSICITSPPYLNNFDYAEMTRMYLYFWRYAGSWSEITERVRSRLIVNTTTVPGALKRDQNRFSETLSESFRSHVQPLIEALREQCRVRAGKKDYYLLVYPYFAQIQSVFRELRRVLRSGSPLHLVIGDAALYGVHIQTHLLLGELLQENGFEVLKIDRLRNRGDRWVLKKRQGANTSLGEFHIYGRRI